MSDLSNHAKGLDCEVSDVNHPSEYDELAALAWRAVDAWMLRAEELDGAMDDLRDYLKQKPEAINLARQLLRGES